MIFPDPPSPPAHPSFFFLFFFSSLHFTSLLLTRFSFVAIIPKTNSVAILRRTHARKVRAFFFLQGELVGLIERNFIREIDDTI